MSMLKTLSNIIRKVIIVSLYAASVIYVLFSLFFPVLLVLYVQENQRVTGGEVDSFWSLFSGAVAESWSLGMLWAGFVLALIFCIIIVCVKKFWPQFQKNEILS